LTAGNTCAGAAPLIAADARSLNRDHVRGIGRYLANIIRISLQLADVRWLLLADRPDLPRHMPQDPHIGVEVFDMPGDRVRAWEQVWAPSRAWRRGADVFWWPATVAAWWQPMRTVVTLHDTIPWAETESDVGSTFYRNRILAGALRRSAAVITPSVCSANDASTLWPALKDTLRVIPHGIDSAYLQAQPDALPPVLSSAGVRRPYVLYLGGEIARKRPLWAFDVWARATQGRCDLVVCGANQPAHAALRQSIPENLRGPVHFLPFVPEAEMAGVYASATLVLYPSLYEGFGFPVLEAQACGTPVVFSPVGSLAELIGPLATVLPPEDLDGWVDACRNLMLKAPPNGQRQASREWAAGFSWERSAREHLDTLLGRIAERRGAS
jgi:glycosyltransferase involved in cell wall biosynthesis